MSALTEALGNSAPAHEFTAGGKTYAVRLVDDGVKVAVEKRLYARAREILRDSKADLTREEYERQLHLLNQDYQAGEFAFESGRGRKYLKTRAGVIHLAALLFQCGEMEMIKVWGENQVEVGSLIKLVLEESFPKPDPKAKAEGADPNAATGEETPVPSPDDERRLW